MRLRTLSLLLAGVLIGVLGAVGTAGYLAFVRPASNPPGDACAGPHDSGRPRVVTAGASVTQGTLGADWVAGLRERYPDREFVNAGVNGSTSGDLLGRLDEVLSCRPVAVTVLVGTNDVRDGIPVDEYRAHLDAIVERLKTGTGTRIALLSLPPLGEDLDGEMNRRLEPYNAAIRQTAERAQVGYLPVHERMADHLRRSPGAGAPFDFGFPLALGAAIQHYLLGRGWDEIAQRDGRALLVDHIHLSDQGGAIIADLVSSWLDGVPVSA